MKVIVKDLGGEQETNRSRPGTGHRHDHSE